MKNSIFKGTGVLVAIILLALTYFACDDSGVTTTITNPQFCITGKLSGWIPGAGNKKLFAQILSNAGGFYWFANCPVDGQGNFNLCLPSFLDTTLYPSDSIFYSGCTGGNVTFDPHDVRGNEMYNFRVFQDSEIVGNISYCNFTRWDSIKAGDFEIGFVYVNKTVTMTGSKICNGDTLQFDGTAQSGWNKFFKHYQRVSPTSRTILYDMIEPPGASWVYHGG